MEPSPPQSPPSHGAGSQVGVLVLELPIQGKATLLPVVTEQRGYGVHLAERGTGRYLVTGQENKTIGAAGLGEGQLLTPSLAPSLSGHKSQGSRFWLKLLKKINSSEPPDWREWP